MALLLLLFVSGFVLAGLKYARLQKDLPPVGNIEVVFGETEAGFLEPAEVYDREGVKLFELIHPRAMDRRWMRVSGIGNDVLSHEVVHAVITSQDENFWANRGHNLKSLFFTILRGDWDINVDELPQTITQQLVVMTILPVEDFSGSPIDRYLREVILAQGLTERYAKEQILEWYLNTLSFGPLTEGIDAASLVYFEKHANDLSLAEGAFLLSLAKEAAQVSHPEYRIVKNLQEQLLQKMEERQLISTTQFRSAISEKIIDNLQQTREQSNLQVSVWEGARELLGPAFQQSMNLEITTSIDYQVQYHVLCLANAYRDLLSSKGEISRLSTLDCESTTDAQHSLFGEMLITRSPLDLAALVMNPGTGEILAYVGQANVPQPSGSMIYPFIYLTSFTKGSSPGSMVLDIPQTSLEAADMETFSDYQPKGPIRIRTALLGGSPYAAEGTVLATGLADVFQVIKQMGIARVGYENEEVTTQKPLERIETSLINASFGYGVLANEGKMSGMRPLDRQIDHDWQELEPILIKQIKAESGMVLYEVAIDERPILSEELAYLVTDVLSDDPARWTDTGFVQSIETYMPAAVMQSANYDEVKWTIGYSPSWVVGVWVQDMGKEAVEGMDASIDPLPLWTSIMQPIAQGLPVETWDVPEGVVFHEVCDPSGLLPTEHCPHVVTEVFLQGTAPFTFDNLYKPIKINKDTGNVATVFTPLDKVEEFVFMIPPPEAWNWAEAEGLMQPPDEYDSITLDDGSKNIGFESPEHFEYIRGRNWISGWMEVENLSHYRVLFGQGLNPTHWYQIGEDQGAPVERGILTLWDTSGLEGLYTLQLIVVDQEGIAQIATRYVTIDNVKPEILVKGPQPGETFHLSQHEYVFYEVAVTDNLGISRVEIYLDNKRIKTIFAAPFVIEIPITESGVVQISAIAYDLAGNESQSEVLKVSILD
jgi:membrane peptidoglycan carboxypeptidase